MTKSIRRHTPVPSGGNTHQIQAALYRFFSQAPLPMALLNGPKHHFVLINSSYQKWFLQSRDVTGQTVQQAIPEAQEQGFINILDDVYKTGNSHVAKSSSILLSKADGQSNRVYFNYCYHALKNDRSEVYGIIIIVDDVTDAVVTQQEKETVNQVLAVEKANLQRIFEDSPIFFAIWVGDALVYEESNRVSTQITGSSPLGQKLENILPQKNISVLANTLRRVMATGKSEHLHNIVFKTTGGKRVFELNCVPRFNLTGIIDGVIASGADVTQRVLTHQRLKKREDQLAQAVRVAKVGFYDWDIKRDKIKMSRFFRSLYQMPSGVCQMQTMDRVHPFDRARLQQDVENCLNTTGSIDTHYRITRDDNTITWLEAMGELSRDENGEAAHLFGTVRDITDLKLTMDALAQQRHLNQNIIDQSPAGIALLCGADSVFVSVNTQWANLVSKRTYVGRTLDEVYGDLPNIQPVLEEIKRVFYHAQPFYLDALKVLVPLDDQTHQERYYNLSAFQVTDGNNEAYGVFCQANDISERIWAREKLELSIGELRSEKSLRERFVATLTHDMRSPLTSAKLCAQRIARASKNFEVVEKLAMRIERVIDRADQMVQNLLDANRIRAGEPLQLLKSYADLKNLLRDAAEDFTQQHGRRFIVDAPKENFEALCDAESLRRVLDNLVGNAVKYGAEDEPIHIYLRVSSNEIEFAVHNEGTPISPDDLENLFQLYRRSNKTLSLGKEGWGIGLALVKAIAEAHGGRINVSSCHEKGTTFSVFIPYMVSE